MRRSLTASLSFVLFLVAFGAPASASTWTVTALPYGSVRSALYGIDCPTVSLCVAVGGNNTVASTTRPTDGAAAWGLVHPGGSFTPPPGEEVVTYAGGQIRGVSCPSSGLCVAAGIEGRILSSADPTGDVTAWNIVPLSGEKEPRVHIFGVSCPLPSLCVAVAYGGKVVWSTNPLGERSAWNVTQLPQPFDLRGVSCPTASFCAAVDNDGNVITSTEPTGGPSAWRSVGTPAGASSLNGISCPSLSLCVTGNAGQIVYSTNPQGGASAWNAIPAGTGIPVEGVSCPSASACAAVDNNADAIVSTAPTGGPSAWWSTNVIPSPVSGNAPPGGNGMFGISCPTTSLCVGAGQSDQLIVSTDPFVADAPKLPAGKKLRRPHVVITGHPAQRLDPRKGGVKVIFRFHAIGKATGFQCKLSGRQFRSCKSPARYRVGKGKNAFRVRALGRGGVKGPPAAFHFRVGHLTERSPVGSCPAGSPEIHACINAR